MLVKGYSLNLLIDPEYGDGCNLTPYPHQVELYHRWKESGADAFLVTTRTGSGKTMAATVPIVTNSESAIYLYPTNALLEDQVKSIAKIVNNLKRPYYVYDGSNSWDIEEYRSSDVLIVVANSETLEKMRKSLGKKTKGEVLRFLLSSITAKSVILLTNPDTIFLLCSLRYRYSGGTLALLQSFQTMVVDEFHLYNGMELANLLFILFYCKQIKVFERLVLLSATPSEEVSRLVDNLFHPIDINCKDLKLPILRSHEVVKDLEFSVVSSEDFVEKCIELIKERRNQIDQMPLSSEANPVPVVIIVDSVVQAIRLEDELIFGMNYPVSEIASYRGLVNPVVRDLNQRRFVIGTSAIEVGVDFDCNILIFNARDFSSFIQRFGRAGRHRSGEVILIDGYRLKEALKLLGNTGTREDLERWAKDSFPTKSDMAWFIKTKYGIWSAYIVVLKGMQIAAETDTLLDSEKEQINSSLDSIFKLYLNGLGLEESSSIVRLVTKVFRANTNVEGRWEKTSLELAGFRPSSYNAHVVIRREFSIGRAEGAEIETTLKRVLEQGTELSIKHNNQKKEINCSVKSFGRRRQVIADIEINDEGIFNMPDIFQFKRKDEVGKNCVGNMDLAGIPMYYCAVSLSPDEDIDWRIETWITPSGKIVAFGGYALLLKAWKELHA